MLPPVHTSAPAALLRRPADARASPAQVAKKLLDVHSNLHAVQAVVSALQAAPIYRLARTWALLGRRERQDFDKVTATRGRH